MSCHQFDLPGQGVQPPLITVSRALRNIPRAPFPPMESQFFALMLSWLNLSQVSAQGFKEPIWSSLNKLNPANLFQIWCCIDSEGIPYFQWDKRYHPAGRTVKFSVVSMIVWVFPSSRRFSLCISASSLDWGSKPLRQRLREFLYKQK